MLGNRKPYKFKMIEGKIREKAINKQTLRENQRRSKVVIPTVPSLGLVRPQGEGLRETLSGANLNFLGNSKELIRNSNKNMGDYGNKYSQRPQQHQAPRPSHLANPKYSQYQQKGGNSDAMRYPK